MKSQIHADVIGDTFSNRSQKVSWVDTLLFVKPASIIFVLAAGLYIAARLWGLTDYSLGFDEIFSLTVVRHDWSGLIDLIVYDVVHPPLFYFLLKLWVGIGGQSLLWLKLFPVSIAVAALAPFVLLCRELKLRAAEMNLALVLMAVNGYLILYAQELRMYSLLLFFTLCSLWLFVRYLNCQNVQKKLLVALFIANLLLVYTQYYGWLVIGVQFVILLVWDRRKLSPFLMMVAGLILCFSPWAYIVLQAAIRKGGLGQNLIVPRPGLHNLVYFYVNLSGAFYTKWKILLGALALVLFFSPIAWWAWHVLKGRRVDGESRAEIFWWLALFAFLPGIIAFAASQVLPHSIWANRYLIILAAPYMLLVAVSVYRLHPNWVRSVAVCLVVGWAALSGFKEVTEFTRVDNIIRVKWESLIHQMIQAEPSQANDLKVYVLDELYMKPHIIVYLKKAKETRFQVVTVDDPSAVNENHFWVACYGSQERELKKDLLDDGYHVGEGFEDGRKVFLFPVSRQ